MNATWDQLRDMRQGGKRPAYRVVITTDRRFAFVNAPPEVMCIVHNPGDALPAELLEGLHVLLWLDSCDQSTAVIRLLRSRGVQPKDLRVWCACYRYFDSGCAPCKDTHETLAWIASLPSEVAA